MKKLFFNSNQKVRIIWKFFLFLLLLILISAPLQIGLREVLDKGLMRGNLSALINVCAVVGSLYVLIKYIERSSFEKFGLKIEGTWMTEFVFGCMIAVVQLSLFFLAMRLTGNLVIQDYFTVNSPDFTFIQGFISELFRQVTVGFAEEIEFRAFLFYIVYETLNGFKKDRAKNAIIACLLVSPLFGLAHFSNDGATIFSTINLGLDAMMIALPFMITGRLAISIGMHFSWNAMQGAIFGFANSGHIAKASIISSTMPDNLWTGGDFGPEGSVLLLVMDALAVLLIIFWKKHKKYDSWVHANIIQNDGQ
ncbi:CPBP family intramembrane glutamic endopeptidase [Reichenbachiella sp.]|uniref:CPBP family intramembrane glutamic endopeptidase n=1 Tax=Reichenbachiella sp. TaxID=2184521 RepID=UPI00329692FD